MIIYHRQLDHEWQTARKETNYALFGNERGDVVASRNLNWGIPPYDYRQEKRHTNAYVKYCDEWRKREYGREYDAHKLAALELRMVETDAFGCADYATEPIKGGIGHL